MIPFTLTPAQFTHRIQHILSHYTPALIATFRQFIRQPIPQAKRGSLILFADHEQGNLQQPELWLYLDSDTLLTSQRSQEIPLFDRTFENRFAFAPEYFEDEYFNGLNLLADELKTWVSQSYWKAGGWDYPLPLELSVDEWGNGDTITLTEAQ